MRRLLLCLFAFLLVCEPARTQNIPGDWRVHLDSLASADRSIRDIDAIALTVSKPLKSWEPFTFSIQGGILKTSGSSIEPSDTLPSPANAKAIFAGGFLRFSPIEPTLITPFAEGGVALLLTDRPFPDHPSLTNFEGRIYGKFDIRWGVDIAVHDDLKVEAAFALTHISNGSGFGPQNINYDGVGFSLGLVRSW